MIKQTSKNRIAEILAVTHNRFDPSVDYFSLYRECRDLMDKTGLHPKLNSPEYDDFEVLRYMAEMHLSGAKKK